MLRGSCLLLCLLAAPGCLGGGSPKLSADPERRGFATPPRPVLLLFVDGLRADVLEEMDRRGEVPRLRRYVFDRAARVRSAVACVPSLTYPNAVSMLTGYWPATHGVWSNECFDRDRLITRNYEDEREHAIEDARAATVFEIMRGELTAAIAMPFARGVKIPIVSSARTGGMQFGVTWVLGREEAADGELSRQLLDIVDQARAIGEWPAFIAVHFPGVDNVGHDEGCDGAGYRQAIANLDESVGEVFAVFEHGGMLDDLAIVLTSDHGHHTTPSSVDLREHLERALDVPVLMDRKNDGGEAYLSRFEEYAPFRAVATVSGARQASLHLRANTRWSDRPDLEAILAFPEPARAGSIAPLPERLLSSAAIDLVVVRAGENAVRVHSRSGSASIERSITPPQPTFHYRTIDGDDPLGYREDARLWAWIGEGPHTSREWLDATAGTDRPDLVPQLSGAFDDARSGDVILFAAPGFDLAGKYAGGHGGVERMEMIVPLYIAGPGVRAGAEIPAARLIDLAPTILELAGVAVRGTRFDGESLVPLLRESEAPDSELKSRSP